MARDGGDQPAVLVNDTQGGVTEFDGDGCACVAEADLDALARNLDAAPTGHFSLSCQLRGWQRVRAGETDASRATGQRSLVQPEPIRAGRTPS